MRLTEPWSWTGSARVRVYRHQPGCLQVHKAAWPCSCWAPLVADDTVPNLITTVGKNMARDMLLGLVADAKVRWFAVGTDATAPAVGQTQLVVEVFRKQTTSIAQGAAGEAINTVFISPNEAVVSIQELGFFCGPAAGAGVNTGLMVARVLYTRAKTSLESIQIDRHDQF